MATNIGNLSNQDNQGVMVRATVILRIPDLDTNELTALYKSINEIIKLYGGEFDINTAPQINPPG